MKIIPTPKITYKKETPNPDHVFPTDLTAKYCSEGKHPDTPGFPINQTEHIAECIDYLSGNEVGTYAASLQFGSGSSFSPDEYPVATYHMINSANKLFNYWENHHRGFHDALTELSVKMTPDNLKELIPPPPPPPKKHLLKFILISVAVTVALIALPTIGYYLGAALFSEVVATTSEIASEIGAAEDVIATSAEGSAESIAARGLIELTVRNPANMEAFSLYDDAEAIVEGEGGETSLLDDFRASSAFRMASYFDRVEDEEDFLDYIVQEGAIRRIHKRDTVPMKFGFYTANMMNSYFLPSLMNNVHQSFTGSGQTYPDISSYLSAASEHLQFHFEDTLHNNFFAGNKSMLASFTVNTVAKKNKRLDKDDIYNSIKNSTYNTMAATIISATLRKLNVEICDTKPSFCGESCDSGHIYCPIVGNDTNSCVITATDNQVKELKYLREPFDICSKANSTGWNLTHNSNCDRNQFQCK